MRKCDVQSERERVSEGGLGGARRTCPFSLARGYRRGNWKRHFGRHHNLKLKCAASGEGWKQHGGSQSQTNLHTGSGVLAPHSALPRRTFPSNLSPENHFELDLLRAPQSRPNVRAEKQAESGRASPRTNTTRSSCGRSGSRSWAGGVANWYCHRVLPAGKMPKQRPKCRAICCGAVVDGIRCVLCQNENNDIKSRKDS